MKLLLGNPGQPDAAITPDRVLEIDQDFQDFQLNDLLKLFATNEVLCPLIRDTIIYFFDGRSPSRHKQSIFIYKMP